jgi:tetratricopeptide (TPR) repeat protein
MAPDSESQARRALNALWEVRRLVTRLGRTNWHAVLATLAPFEQAEYLSGAASRKSSNDILALVHAAIGDAHRELKQPLEAAAAYRRAVSFRPMAAYGDYYVALVLKERLEEHYEPALRAVVEGQALWRHHGASVRLTSHVLSVLLSPVDYLSYVWNRLIRDRRLRQLRARIAARHA